MAVATLSEAQANQPAIKEMPRVPLKDMKGTSPSKTKRSQPRIISDEALLHDRFNLYALPVLGIAAILGIVGLMDGMLTTYMLTAYIVLDLAWIVVIPAAVPALPGVIIFHHLVTLVLLAYPLRYPHFSIYSNWDGLVEVNTFFLVARRQVNAPLLCSPVPVCRPRERDLGISQGQGATKQKNSASSALKTRVACR